MEWTVVYLNDDVRAEVEALSADLQAKFRRIVELIRSKGLERVREPYVKHLEGRLWEMRLIGRDNIARVVYVAASARRVVVLPRLHQEDREDAAARPGDRASKGKGGHVSRKYIPVEESFRRWGRKAEFRRAYESLDDEFTLAAALIDARSYAGLSQEDVADRMRTAQQTVSRLEGGHANPSLRTLRRFAEATGTRLNISFLPTKKAKRTR